MPKETQRSKSSKSRKPKKKTANTSALSYKNRQRTQNIQKDKVIARNEEELQKQNSNNIYTEFKDYVDCDLELKHLTTKIKPKKTRFGGKMNKRSRAKHNTMIIKEDSAKVSKLDEALKRQLKRPIGAIAEEVSEFVQHHATAYIEGVEKRAKERCKILEKRWFKLFMWVILGLETESDRVYSDFGLWLVKAHELYMLSIVMIVIKCRYFILFNSENQNNLIRY